MTKIEGQGRVGPGWPVRGALGLITLTLLGGFQACIPPGKTTVPPPVERLRLAGSADASRPIDIAWDEPDPAWNRVGLVYRVRLQQNSGPPVLWERTVSATQVQLPAGRVPNGTRVRVTLETGDGSPPVWSRARLLEFRTGSDLDLDRIDDRLETRIARMFAPELRFNARVGGDSSYQNRDEVFFPTSIHSFNRSIHSEWVQHADPETGRQTLVPNPWGRPFLRFPGSPQTTRIGDLSADDNHGTVWTGRLAQETAAETKDVDLMRLRSPDGRTLTALATSEVHLDGIPKNLPGDAPGKGTVYTHVYPISSTLRIDGSREERYGIEYWFFYTQDTAGRINTGRVGLGSISIRTGGHIGDWEHVAYEIVREVEASGRETRLELVRGIHHGHAHEIEVTASNLQFVPGTKHPRIYVSWGKHASYPAAGIWRNEAPLFDDIFHGNGPIHATWKSPLVDLGERGQLRPGCSWAAFPGRWGQNDMVFGLGSSPTGPTQKGSWGNLKAKWTFAQWKQQTGVKLD